MSLPSSDAPLSSGEVQQIANTALDEGRLGRAPAERLAANLADRDVLEAVLDAASESKRRAHGDVVSVSRNIFIPLTNLCRNRCNYCTFAKLPDSAEAKTYTLEEVDEATSGGVATGCIEALFCLGDKPEVAYKSYRAELDERGYASTTELLLEACKVSLRGGMLPHTNAGILTGEELELLRPWNASMGLMMETTSERLRGKGMPHMHAPDKDPKVRIRMHEAAGELKIPFTSGILLGIGENNEERVDTLLTIRDLDDRFGHIQEVIVQPFHPKPGTKMRAASSLLDDVVAGWVALARLMLGPAQNVQAPPNLAPEVLPLLLRSGLNDWGGVSPVTLDFINPEAPWPALRELREATEGAGHTLVERLPVYPNYINDRPEFFDVEMRKSIARFTNDAGFARSESSIPPPRSQSVLPKGSQLDA
jgi:7,8-didemethyl-8-hydroxy-5-deazariboflavin synthase CofG subunit